MNDCYMSYWHEVRHIEGAAQRVQEDTMRFARIVEGLGVAFMRSVMTLVAFLPLLWSLSEHLTELPWIGAVDHSLVWLAVVSAAAGPAADRMTTRAAEVAARRQGSRSLTWTASALPRGYGVPPRQGRPTFVRSSTRSGSCRGWGVSGVPFLGCVQVARTIRVRKERTPVHRHLNPSTR